MRRIPLYFSLSILSLTFLFAPVPEALGEDRCAGSTTVSSMDEIPVRTELTRKESANLRHLKRELIKEGIPKEEVEAIFSDPAFGLNDIGVKLAKNNPEKKVATGEETYQWYKRCFGLERRIKSYKDFIAEYRSDLTGAEKKYGVDARYIVSILGVESDFARDQGRFKAVNALTTQYLLVERRRGYAYRQLVELIGYSKKTEMKLYDITSSYMGAIGCGQFIPASLNHYFVGETGKVEEADPFNVTDCIYSIAYYLKRSRWDRKENGKTPTKGSKNWKAIRAYNHSDAYTRFVIETADRLKVLD
ncbi:MAG: lytic murein transglycosylase [Proteobacteria bacterium]|nr:lytic murein transglycosylase [Pseudomonadota bacterium]